MIDYVYGNQQKEKDLQDFPHPDSAFTSGSFVCLSHEIILTETGHASNGVTYKGLIYLV